MEAQDTNHCQGCGRLLASQTAICATCSAADEQESATVSSAAKRPSVWLVSAILSFPVWGVGLFAWLAKETGSAGLFNLGVGLALFSSVPIVLSDSLGLVAKIVLTIGYYWFAVPAAVLTLLAVSGQA